MLSNADSWRLHYTYWIAIGILVAVFALVILKLPDISAETLIAFVAGLSSGVVLFVFNRETGAGASRATERAVAQGSAGGSSPADEPVAPVAPAKP